MMRDPDSAHMANSFEMACEPAMVRFCANRVCAATSQTEMDARVTALISALNRAGERHFGTKLVGATSKSWFDVELRTVSSIIVLARKIIAAAKSGSEASLLARGSLTDAKQLFSSLCNTKRRAHEFVACRAIERVFGSSKLFWSKWKSRTRETTSTPTSVLNADGETVSGDPLKILQVWRDYAEQLGCGSLPKSKHGDHSSYDSSYDDDFAARVRAELCESGSITELSTPITWEEVHLVIRALPLGRMASRASYSSLQAWAWKWL